MSVVVSDLVARVRAEGVEQTAQQVKAVGDAATQTARALQIMAEQAARSAPTQGSATQILELFQRTNVQPTAAAMAQAAQEMQRTATAAAATVQPAQNVARAAMDHAAAARTGALAAQQVADGWKVSESSIVRFGTALVGINLGISLVAGAARLIHDAIVDTVTTQLDWERSLVQVRALYGDIAPRVVALSQAQAAMPGVISSQQELLQANAAAGFLTTRYGVSPTTTGALTTQAARLGGLFVLPEDQRQALQAAAIQYAQTGGGGAQLEQATGQPFDPEALARRMGFPSAAALQGLTPQQLADARAQLAIANLAQTNIQGAQQQQPALITAQREMQRRLQEARDRVQNVVEGTGTSSLTSYEAYVGLAGEGAASPGAAAFGLGAAPIQQQVPVAPSPLAALEDVKEAREAILKNSAAIASNQRQIEASNAALEKFGVSAGSAASRLLTFTGSLENLTSIARGDIGAQAQSAVAARGRSAIPSFGTPSTEIFFNATQTAYQSAYQNYVAQQAQGSQDNAIREWLQQRVNQEGPGGQAQRALDQATQTQPIFRAMGENQRTQAQIELAAAERQAQLDQISLTQRERYVQLMRDTLDLRLLDNAQQQRGIEANMMLIRAQQAALPAQYRASDAQYQQNLAQAIAQQRMGRLLQGQSVADLPTLDQLIQMNYQGQLAAAENAPSLVQSNRQVELEQRPVQQIALLQGITESNIRLAELTNEARNLQDIPQQTQYELELVQINRDQISVQTEMRELLKALVYYMTNAVQGPPSAAGQVADQADRIARQTATYLLNGVSAPSAPVAPPELPGNRRGPY